MVTVSVLIPVKTRDDLQKMADRDIRTVEQQAHFYIKEGLQNELDWKELEKIRQQRRNSYDREGEATESLQEGLQTEP